MAAIDKAVHFRKPTSFFMVESFGFVDEGKRDHGKQGGAMLIILHDSQKLKCSQTLEASRQTIKEGVNCGESEVVGNRVIGADHRSTLDQLMHADGLHLPTVENCRSSRLKIRRASFLQPAPLLSWRLPAGRTLRDHPFSCSGCGAGNC